MGFRRSLPDCVKLRTDLKAGMRYAEFARHTMEPLTNKDMDGGLLYLYSTKDISQKAFMFGPTVGIKGKAPSLPGSVIGKAGVAHVTGDTSITGSASIFCRPTACVVGNSHREALWWLSFVARLFQRNCLDG